jgi:hypothetical protein
MFGLFASKRLDRWTALFLAATVATSVTGFFFPFHGFTPAIGVGIISLVVLAVAIFARYPRHLALDICGDSHDRALSECLCFSSAAFPKSAKPEGISFHPG